LPKGAFWFRKELPRCRKGVSGSEKSYCSLLATVNAKKCYGGEHLVVVCETEAKMTDFFIKDAEQDDRLANMAVPGDLDMIISPKDGALVVVAQVDGVHVCGRCLEQFIEDPHSPHRGVEWNPPNGQGTRMMLHAGCVKASTRTSGNLLNDMVRGHQLKRLATRATSFLRKKT
jgi:hypothetical protein